MRKLPRKLKTVKMQQRKNARMKNQVPLRSNLDLHPIKALPVPTNARMKKQVPRSRNVCLVRRSSELQQLPNPPSATVVNSIIVFNMHLPTMAMCHRPDDTRARADMLKIHHASTSYAC